MNTALPLTKRVAPPMLLALAVALTAAIPLLSNRWFYYWDDSAAAFAPAWHTIGERLLAGSWPTLIPEMWAGGNITAEALYGTYNPVLLADSVVIALIPNLAIGITLVKMQFMAILAVGVYVLARQFGARQSMAFVAGFAMPFAGYTLYFDASSWASGLIAFAWLPHVWWSTRAAARGTVNPFVSVVFGLLAMTTGNPYGAVGVAVVYLAVATECIFTGRARRILSMVWSGAAVLAMALIVYLPLAFTTGVSVRTQSGVSNDGALRPDLGDLLNLSAPSNLPLVSVFGSSYTTIPLGFLAWFIIPLAPWLKWSELKFLTRQGPSLLVFFGIYLVLLLGPSNLWLFRWPARLIGYGQLPIVIAFAVAASAGLYRDRAKVRALISAVLLLAQFYLSWSNVPEDLGIHALSLLVCAVLTAIVILSACRYPKGVVGGLVLGTLTILSLQTVAWFPGNDNVTPWRFPRQIGFMQDRFENRYTGNTFVVADTKYISPDDPTGQWGDLLFGNAWQPAGVRAINSYAGISYGDFVKALCLNYYGGVTCPDAVLRLDATAPGTDVSWLDALKLETVVVQNSGPYGGYHAFDSFSPDEWTIDKSRGVTVARRNAPLPWPDGRLSAVGPDVTIEDDSAATDTSETVQYSGSGTATFALLAWPGWTATVDGTEVPITATPGGLIQVDLPSTSKGGSSLDLTYAPPGRALGIGLAALGLAAALGQAILYSVMRRRQNQAVRTEADEVTSSTTP
ncbi:hypothetical protein E5720_09385 [Rhodococcus sp. PAMC28707]|uniref:hypothetical protein n=1 Tax=unclassified Rhodococcus (in: high G+C Gram-positive bacteria) TaxID=192944 RepID=UPI00109DD24E|nr:MULTISPECIES: hypothetical protein [unclassified Rhodococcus (in: high G+C Gram-positive bacteria)]QCB49613.1 hypothetical protein E5769_04630 [Rhodococcus sp. PAMC28705]QCB58696.1 hypothetical protein E5720_09385 [Rhodococcus sp. PAMC28707]